MRERQTNKPRGFGFVTFRDSSAADRAVGASHTIDGRQVRGYQRLPSFRAAYRSKSFKSYCVGRGKKSYTAGTDSTE